MMKQDTDSLNQKFYLNKAAASWYGGKQFVLPEEQAFLAEHAAEVHGAKILDMGIGGGRSARFLLPLAEDYVGIDYSPDMIKVAQSIFPGAKMEVRDARDLSCYNDDQFDVAFFSFNGMDCIAHEGRLQTLKEVHRVLKDGGLFAFSSHNREREASKPYALKYLSRSKHPIRMSSYFLAYLDGILSWWKTRNLAFACAEYELRHDSGNFFKVPMYYIGLGAQVEQLRKSGFEVLSVYDTKGNKLETGAGTQDSPWLFYSCRKALS